MPGDGETLARESPMATHFNVRPSAHMHWEPTVDRASVSNPHSRPASIARESPTSGIPSRLTAGSWTGTCPGHRGTPVWNQPGALVPGC